MNINKINASSAIAQYQAATKVSKPQSNVPVQEPDSFIVSEDSKIYAQAHMTLKRMLQSENINAAKVSQIKDDIKSGVYNVSINDVVDKMLEG